MGTPGNNKSGYPAFRMPVEVSRLKMTSTNQTGCRQHRGNQDENLLFHRHSRPVSSGQARQKVSEAEVFVRAGVKDILVSNQVRDPAKIDRLARLPRYDARIIVCVDDLSNVTELSAAAQKHGTRLECFACRFGMTVLALTPRYWKRAGAVDIGACLESANAQN